MVECRDVDDCWSFGRYFTLWICATINCDASAPGESRFRNVPNAGETQRDSDVIGQKETFFKG
jgi:hypothetical protein